MKKSYAILVGACMLALSLSATSFSKEKSPAANNAEKTELKFDNKAPTISIDFNDVDLRSFIKFMSEMTGKNFIVSSRVRPKKITIISPKPVDLKEAYKVFESTLEAYGYTLIPVNHVIKIVPSTEARRKPVPVYRGSKKNSEDRFMVQIVKLKWAKEADVRRAIASFVSREGMVTGYAPTNTIIVADFKSNIDKLYDIIKSIDVPSEENKIEVIKLSYANAANVAKDLKTIFSALITEKKKEGKSATFIAIPYERLNSVLVLTSPEFLNEAENMVQKIDQPIETGKGNIHVVKLNNASAEKLAQVLDKLVGAKVTSAKGKTGKAIISKETKIVADKSTNSLVITASKEEFEKIQNIIKKLDVSRKEVFVEAVIMEVSNENSLNFGINWQGGGDPGKGNGQSVLFGAANGAVGTTFDELKKRLMLSSSGLAFGVLSFPFTYDANHDGTIEPDEHYFSLGSFIHASKDSNNVNIVSTPQLTVMENEEASVVVAENRPFQTKIETTNDNDYANYEYKNIGVTLKITPQINDDGFVKLKIYQEVSRVDEASTQSSVYALRPITKQRTVETTISVKDGDTAVIAGLIEDTLSDNTNKVPLLGDIPVAGNLFKNRVKKRSKKNLIIFVTPHVIKTEADMRELYFKKAKYMYKLRYDVKGNIEPSEKGLFLPSFEIFN
jgi:general secretion pathway protein D